MHFLWSHSHPRCTLSCTDCYRTKKNRKKQRYNTDSHTVGSHDACEPSQQTPQQTGREPPERRRDQSADDGTSINHSLKLTFHLHNMTLQNGSRQDIFSYTRHFSQSRLEADPESSLSSSAAACSTCRTNRRLYTAAASGKSSLPFFELPGLCDNVKGSSGCRAEPF